MLAGLDWQEADERNLHARQSAQGIPGGIADVEPRAIPAHENQRERVDWEQAGDESVSTPRGNHVAVEEGAHGAPEHGALLQCLDPEEEGKDQEEDGDGLIVVASGHGARDVTGGDTHEHGGEETGRGRRGHLIGEEIGGYGRESRERGCEQDADVADINRDCKESKEVVDGAAGDHEARVQGSSGNPTERMPCPVVEPVPELLEAIGDEILCSAEVKPGVDYGRQSQHEIRVEGRTAELEGD